MYKTAERLLLEQTLINLKKDQDGSVNKIDVSAMTDQEIETEINTAISAA